MARKKPTGEFITSYAEEAEIERANRERESAEAQEETQVTPTIVWRKISELHKADYNARRATPQQRASLRECMEKFGWQGSYAVININPERKDIIVSGHLRIDVWEKDLKNDMCPCIEVNLTEEEERELNIRLNKNGGEFDTDLLMKFFEKEDLVMFGFNSNELPTLDEVFEDDDLPDVVPDEPVYPIVPKFNEQYAMFCIVTENELDETWLRNVLRISRMASYKSSAVAPSFVISCDDFKNAIQEYAENTRPDDSEDFDVDGMEIM
jgi:hypothetical protein